MIYQHVVENISKLMKFWNLSIYDLADKTGLTANGIKNMFANGSFKLDSISRIANVLNVPDYVLFSEKIELQRESIKGKLNIVITYTMPDFEKSVHDDVIDLEAKITLISADAVFWKTQAKEIEQSYYNLQDIEEKKDELISTLKSQLQDKETIIELLKRTSTPPAPGQ